MVEQILDALKKGVFYAGIGSRETPRDIMELMESLARVLASKGAVLRSGGADGADTAFETGAANGEKEIYLPWPLFNGNVSPFYSYTKRHYDVAAKHHPNWQNLTASTRKMMARNTAQIFGLDFLVPSAAVICWTHGAAFIGGTSQAMRIAVSESIPIINLAYRKDLKDVSSFIDSNQ